MIITIINNYYQLSQTQLNQTFTKKFTITKKLLQSLKKTTLSKNKKNIKLLHNITLNYNKFKKKTKNILYHIIKTPTNKTLSIIQLIKNTYLKLYNLTHITTNSPLKSHNSNNLLFKKLFSPSKLITIINNKIPLISKKQSLSKILLNNKNNKLNNNTNF